MKSSLRQLALLAVATLFAVPAAGQRTEMLHVYNSAPEDLSVPAVRTYFIATTANEDDVEAFRRRLIDAGARNVNWFAPDVVVCELPAGASADAVDARGFTRWSEDAVPDAAAPGFPSRAADVRRAYALMESRREKTPQQDRSAPVLGDEFKDLVFEITPERAKEIQRRVDDVLRDAGSPDDIQRSVNQNSEILTGSIKIYIMFPESNGTIDPKTETWKRPDGVENQDYLDARTNAFATYLDWQAQWPNMGITFTVFDVLVDCNYEPIHHNSTDDDLWINDVLTRLEPDAIGIDDPLAACHVFNTKRRGGYDWIYTTFIGHSRNEPTHRFRNAGYTAYAYLGGPYNVNPFPAGTDPNEIGEGLVFSKIIQHETGHTFWCLDEYPGSPGNCAAKSGYLDYSNQNISMVGPNGITRCIGEEYDCIMHSAAREDVGRPWCRWSLGHLGVIDDNTNSIPDVFEAKPLIVFTTAQRETVETDDVTVRVSAQSQAVPNRNRAWTEAERVNYAAPLRQAQFAIGGGWLELPAADGKWDEDVEESSIQLDGLPPGLTEVRFRVRNAVGLWSDIHVAQIYFIGVNYLGLSLTPRDNQIEVRWQVEGDAFGASFDVHRVDDDSVIPDLRFLDPTEPLPGTRVAEAVPSYDDGKNDGLTSYRFIDKDVTPGVKYRYFVSGSGVVDVGNGPHPFRTPSHVVAETAMVPVPTGHLISHAAPNPFRNDITFSLFVPRTPEQIATGSEAGGTRVDVVIYDVLGRRVKTLIGRNELREVITLRWDGTNERNTPVSSGVYFIRAKAGAERAVEKVLLVR